MPLAPPTYRLRTLFGVTTLVVGVCALAAKMTSTPPSRVGWIVLAIGVVLGLFVGARRRAWWVERVMVSLVFMFGSLLLAAYLATVALVAQISKDAGEGAVLAATFGATKLVIFFPVMLMTLVMMIRAWTWSAYDANPLPEAQPA
jgi:hypothetical protein